MLSIALRFPTGRYHATPWDQHVNEGGVEWPPSPWRLLRALAATWHLKAQGDIEAAALADLVEALASGPPSYHMPPATGAHTRHYMAIGQLKDGVERTTKVFDTFIHLGAGASVIITWPALTLTDERRATLELLLQRMAYLGRAESWVEARLVTSADGKTAPVNVVPLEPDVAPSPDQELIRVLCPMSSKAIDAWRTRTFEEESERRLAEKRRAAEAKGKDPNKIKLSKADKGKVDAALPQSLVDALEVETDNLQKQGWSGVPGTRWVDYVRPRDLLTTLPRRTPTPNTQELPTAARFALASQVLARLTECLSLAERVRVALMSRSEAAPVFSGKQPNGEPLQGHRHTFILPEANGTHGRITHVTLYAPMGFDDAARRAMDGLRDVWGRGGHDVQLVLLGVGQPEDFAGTDLRAGQCPLFVKAETWVSRTPFIPTRHAKVKGGGAPKRDADGVQIGSPLHDLRRLLGSAGFPEPVRVGPVDSTDLGGKQVRWLEFKTVRYRGEGARSMNRGFGFHVAFPQPVRGPIAVGYGAHFGMGTFRPAEM